MDYLSFKFHEIIIFLSNMIEFSFGDNGLFSYPTDTWRNDNVIITPKTTLQRRYSELNEDL